MYFYCILRVRYLPVTRRKPYPRLQEVDRPLRRRNTVVPSDGVQFADFLWPGRLYWRLPTGVRYAGSTVCTTKPSCRQWITRNRSSRRRRSGCTLEEGTGSAKRTMRRVALAAADDVLRPSRSPTPTPHRASNCVLRRRSVADRTRRHK